MLWSPRRSACPAECPAEYVQCTSYSANAGFVRKRGQEQRSYAGKERRYTVLESYHTVHEQGCQVKGAQLTFLGRGRATPRIGQARQSDGGKN
jgi:hypothetical protein